MRVSTFLQLVVALEVLSRSVTADKTWARKRSRSYEEEEALIELWPVTAKSCSTSILSFRSGKRRKNSCVGTKLVPLCYRETVAQLSEFHLKSRGRIAVTNALKSHLVYTCDCLLQP